MRFTEDEIESKALELAKAGVGQKDIETWIDLARKERESFLAQERGTAAPAAAAVRGHAARRYG